MPDVKMIRSVMGPDGPEIHINRNDAYVVLFSWLVGGRLVSLPPETLAMDLEEIMALLGGRYVTGLLIEGDCDHKIVFRSFPNDMR